MFQQKRKTTDKVRTRFARFGDEVLGIVLGYALQPKYMTQLLNRLNKKPVHELDAQLDAIQSFIATFGSKEFIKRIRQTKQKEVEAIDIEALEMEADPIAEMDAPGGENDALAPGPAMVDTPQYRGPERRKGRERRSFKDRRDAVEAISKNKRYGKNRRRLPRGRRKGDGPR